MRRSEELVRTVCLYLISAHLGAFFLSGPIRDQRGVIWQGFMPPKYISGRGGQPFGRVFLLYRVTYPR